MLLERVAGLYPLPRELFVPYLKAGITPPLDADRITSSFVVGSQRKTLLRTPTTGDASLVIGYTRRNRVHEGAIISFQIEDSCLSVLQVQGALDRNSYRVITGLRFLSFAADQIRRISCFLSRDKSINKIKLPLPYLIEGIENSDSEHAFERYRKIASILELEELAQERAFVGKPEELAKSCANRCAGCLPVNASVTRTEVFA